MKYKFTILLLVATMGFALAQQTEPLAYSFPEYNQRFLENQLAPVLEPAKTIYVSKKGSFFANGSKSRPYKTLEAARDAVRKLKKKSGLPKGGVHIVLMEGNYRFKDTFQLTEQDSGTKDAPIVYRGVNAKDVQISGGFEIDTKNMKLVEDEATLARIHESAHGKVMVVDVPEAAKVCFPGDGELGMISMDGYLLTLSQWPNRGYNHIGSILDAGPTTRWLKPGEEPAPYSKEKPNGGKFTFKEQVSPLLQKEFERSGEMLAQGYFHNDWYFQNEPVGSIEGDVVGLLHHTRYGIVNQIKSMPRRVRLVNVLCELDEQGEWYYDKVDNKLFVWPIKGFTPGKSKLFALGGEKLQAADGLQEYGGVVSTSLGGAALVTLQDTSYITFRDLTFENTGNQAIGISGGEYNLIAGCTIRNGLNKGITIGGGKHNGITGCDIYGLECAFNISGGDFKTLERCYNFATNNNIHNCRMRGYGMTNLDGVGLYFAHNVIHDMNGAVNYKSVDMLMEYNEFYNIGYEMGDFNVAYCGSVWYSMNNVVRYNFVHHLIEPGGHPVCGFRNDDGGAGLKIYGNVFYRPGRGAAQFAGPLNLLQNNITMECNIMWWTNKAAITPEDIAARWKSLEQFGRDLPHGDKGDNIYIMEKLLGEKGWLKSPWIDEFPELAKMLEINPFAQTFDVVDKNYVYKVSQPFHIHGGGGDIAGMEDNRVGKFEDLPSTGRFALPAKITLDAFVDVTSLNFNFKEDFKPMEGFKPIPFDEIGFVADEFRPTPPCKDEYRKEAYKKFKDDRGGRYDQAKVNARYPEPAYLQ